MSAPIPIDDPNDPRLAPYRGVRDPDLVRRQGLFLAESREVVRRLLSSPIEVVSVLVTESALTALRDDLDRTSAPVYLAPRALLRTLTGYPIHRGALAAAARPPAPRWEELLGATTLVALEGVGDPDNVGAVFRSARALGAGGILLGPGCADPFYRKAIRTSMAATLVVPHAHPAPWPACLGSMRQAGYRVVALTPRTEATDLRDLPAPVPTVLLAGSEGHGLSEDALAAADTWARIPMAEGADSLNVAVATAIALHHLAGC